MEDLLVDPSGQITTRSARSRARDDRQPRAARVVCAETASSTPTKSPTFGLEAVDLVDRMKQQGNRLLLLLPLIGRIDVVNFPNNIDFVGYRLVRRHLTSSSPTATWRG